MQILLVSPNHRKLDNDTNDIQSHVPIAYLVVFESLENASIKWTKQRNAMPMLIKTSIDKSRWNVSNR